MRLRLPELQDNNTKTKKLRSKDLSKGWEDIEGIFQYQDFSYISEIIHSKWIDHHHNDLLVSYFGIDKT